MASRSAACAIITVAIPALFGGQGCGDATTSAGRADAQAVVEANFIGTDRFGQRKLANRFDGVFIIRSDASIRNKPGQ